MEFNDSHKQEYQRRFPFGVSKVLISSFQLDQTEDGKEFVEVFFTSEDGNIDDSARVWFTTDKSAQFAFNTLRDILVHNQKEENKDKAREAMMKISNTTAMVELLNTKLVGKEMWITKYLDPKRTYESNGRTLKSVNTNIYGYEPALQPELMPSDQGATEVDMVDAAEKTFGVKAEPASQSDPTDNWG